MKPEAAKLHLKPYRIVRQRRTTINHAFAAAIAPCDDYDLDSVKRAITLLGQNPEQELRCVYCEVPAETWDHVLATVQHGKFSGAGHRIANLVPCCKPCNSAKGNKDWKIFLSQREPSESIREKRAQRIAAHIATMPLDRLPTENPAYVEFMEIKAQVLDLLLKADLLAEKIRSEAKTSALKS